MASAGLSRRSLADHDRLERRATAPPNIYKMGRRGFSPQREPSGLLTTRQKTHLALSSTKRDPEKDESQQSSSNDHASVSSAQSIAPALTVPRPGKMSISKWRKGKSFMVGMSTNGKSSKPKVNYQNSFKMEPDPATAFNEQKTKHEVEAVLKRFFDPLEAYDPERCAVLSRATSEEIKTRVKGLGFQRYKLAVHVAIGQNMGQGLNVGSRGAWDPKTDDVISVVYEKKDLFVVATVFGVYFE